MTSLRSALLRLSSSATLSSSLAVCVLFTLPTTLAGCKHASAGPPNVVSIVQVTDADRAQMDLIPPPSKTRYMAIHTLTSWENPYLTVQENMATLHVTLADANPSSLGVGGMLRPIGARRQTLNVRISDLPDAMNAIPEDAWPYGRVVAVEEAHDAPAAARPAIRRSVETTIKALGDLGVVVYEWNDSTASH